jgi:hypothetical protein
MMCIIPRANLVQNIGFDQQATHTFEREFADLEMHRIQPLSFPLIDSSVSQVDRRLDDLVFQRHYERLEGRRTLWQKLHDRLMRKKRK